MIKVNEIDIEVVAPTPKMLYNKVIANKGAVQIDNISNINKLNIKRKNEDKLKLTKEQEKKLNSNLKIGILKQLHKEQLLTDVQLNSLIAKQI